MIFISYVVLLSIDRMRLCDVLMADGQPDVNCTVGVDNITSYTSTFDRLEISDQGSNPSGTFNQTELRDQARPLTYAVTELTNRSDVMMLYEDVLPGRDIPNLEFLIEPMPTPTTTVVTPTATGDMPKPTDGGTTAVSFSLFITLVALLFTSVFL